MDTAALEFATDPLQKLLSKHYEAPGARKVEHLFKTASFSIDVAPTPPQKRRRLNMNVSAQDPPPTQNHKTPPAYPNRNGGRSGGRPSGGRGNYNRNYKSPRGFQFFGGNQRRQENSPTSSARSEYQCSDHTSLGMSSGDSRPKPRPAIQGRIFNWDNM